VVSPYESGVPLRTAAVATRTISDADQVEMLAANAPRSRKTVATALFSSLRGVL